MGYGKTRGLVYMAAKNPHGNQIYDLLVDLIFSLSPYQAEHLYAELLPKYTRRSKTKLYNANGELDAENGKIRLLPLQYKALRTKFGDTYIKKAFTELTNYIEYLERNIDYGNNKQKLKTYQSKTHNMYLTEGWVYKKCEQYIVKDRPSLAINPFLIEDFNTAKEYIKTVPKELRDSIDVQMLLTKFPELVDVI